MSEELTTGERYDEANEAALEAYEEAHEEPQEDAGETQEDDPSVDMDEEIKADTGESEATESNLEAESEGDVTEDSEPVAEAVPDQVEWDGNPETIPEQLKSTYANMVKGMNAKFQEVADLKRKLQAELDAANSKPEAAPQEDEMPPYPADGDSQDEYNKKWAAINAYNARQEVNKVLAEKGKDPELAEVKQALEAQKRYEMLTQTEGYSPEIEAQMGQIAQENPFWLNQLQTSDEGTFSLFTMAKAMVDADKVKSDGKDLAAKVADQKIRQKAKAARGRTTRPGGGGKASAAHNFAKMGFDELNRLALEEYESNRK